MSVVSSNFSYKSEGRSYPFVWHLALFVLGALGASAWVSMLRASHLDINEILPKATTKKTLNIYFLRKLGKKL